jgi:hypothetical protein
MEQDEFSGDDKSEDADGDLAFEQFFGEADLDDAEADEAGDDSDMGDDEAADDLGGDLFGGDDAEAGEDADLGGDAEMADDAADFGDDAEGDIDAEGDTDTDIEDLKKAIEELQQEFERLQSGDAGAESDAEDFGGDDAEIADDAEGDAGDETMDFGGDAEGDDVAADDAEDAEGETAEGDDEDDFFESLDSLLADDFDDLTEGAVDDLEVVKTGNKHALIGAQSGETGGFSGNDQSPIPMVSKEKRQGGKAVQIKGSQHSGYDREQAPGTKAGTGAKAPKNIKTKATADQSKVKKSGNDAALLNQNTGFGEEGRKSPLGNMGTKSLQK